MSDRITIRKPDDWHLDVRDGAPLKAALPEGVDFTPFMTCDMTDDTDPDEIEWRVAEA